MEKIIEVMITDDKPVYRKMIRETLEPYDNIVKVIGEAENGIELLKLLEKRQPDIILLDLEMPLMDGNVVFKLIREYHPKIRVIIISMHFHFTLVENYIDRGARGYIPKEMIYDPPHLLINAITKVYAGGKFIYEPPHNAEKFTAAQKELLPLIFEGKTNDEIAEELKVTRRAVEKQKQALYKKTDSKKPVDFYLYSISRGMQYISRIFKSK